MNSKRGIAPFVILVVIALIAVGAGSWVYLDKSEEPREKITDSATTTEEKVATPASATTTPAAKVTKGVKTEVKTPAPSPVVVETPKPVTQATPTLRPANTAKSMGITEAEYKAWLASGKDGWWYVDEPTPVYNCPTLNCEVVGTVLLRTAWYGIRTNLSAWGWTSERKDGYIAPDKAIFLGDKVEACSVVLDYDIGTIGSKFLANGFDKAKLRSLAIEAEGKWEVALGKNMWNLVDGSDSTISFGGTIDQGDAFGSIERSGHDILTLHFDITVSDHAIDWSPEGDKEYMAKEITVVIMHELGHSLGIDHLSENGDIMSTTSDWDENGGNLSPRDLQAMKEVCAKTER